MRSDPQVCGVEGRREDGILECARKRDRERRNEKMGVGGREGGATSS